MPTKKKLGKKAAKLTVHENGFVEIKTEAQAIEALEAFKRLKDEIDEIKKESGLDDLEKDAVAYKAAVQNYMIANDLEQLQAEGFHGTLVKGFHDSRWVTDEDDLKGDEPTHCLPLKTLIERKFKSKVDTKGSKARKVWLKITRRVADHNAIEEAVARGDFTVDDISAAWVEKPRAPYLRVFEG